MKRNKVINPMKQPLMLVWFVILSINLHGEAQNDIPRPEHPKPQFIREHWLNLNGVWDFAIDNTLSGKEKSWYKDPSKFDKKIIVPFCPESELSGIGNTDFMNAVWYSRKFSVPENWNGQRVFLNFGGVDYKCTAYVNGEKVGSHYGGSASFSFEISTQIHDGENTVVILAEDDIRGGRQPGGKQTRAYSNRGFSYTRTTGIWQSHFANQPSKNSMNRGKWGYGKTAEEMVRLISSLTKVLTDNPKIAGYAFTQLTDVFQEINGIYTFDRELKYPVEDIKKAFVQPATIEKE